MSTVLFDHIGLSVDDLERQLRFIEAFGSSDEHRSEIPAAGIRMAVWSNPAGGAIELTERVGGSSTSQTPSRAQASRAIDGLTGGRPGHDHRHRSRLRAGAISSPAPARRPRHPLRLRR